LFTLRQILTLAEICAKNYPKTFQISLKVLLKVFKNDPKRLTTLFVGHAVLYTLKKTTVVYYIMLSCVCYIITLLDEDKHSCLILLE